MKLASLTKANPIYSISLALVRLKIRKLWYDLYIDISTSNYSIY